VSSEKSPNRSSNPLRPKDYPHAMHIGRQTVSLPLSAKLGDDDVADVITAVHKIIGNRSG
jgi:dTDP-4-amino-4,6-dideoxygalactose transaminase